MAPISSYLENTLGNLFYSFKGRDNKLLSRSSPALAQLPPTATISSSELGATSPATFHAGKHELLGDNVFPELSWTVSEAEASKVRSWLLIVEDADAPLPSPIVHGIYYDIPATTRTLSAADFEPNATDTGSRLLRGNFRYGANRRGTVWTGPRPVLGHGNHRYFFQLIGLNVEALSTQGTTTATTPPSTITKEQLLDEKTGLGGKVVCWGQYIANFERKLGA